MLRRACPQLLMLVLLMLGPSSYAAGSPPPGPRTAPPTASPKTSPGIPPPPPPPPAPPVSESLPQAVKTEYEAGKILFQDGDYATALLKFQDAYDKVNDPRLLWNVGACLKNLRHYAKALVVLRKYAAADSLTAQDRQDARDLIGAIEPFATSVTFKVSEDGAEVALDDEVLGTSPLAGPLLVDIGTRRLRIKKEGFRLVEKEIAVGGAKDAVVDVVLEKAGGHLELAVDQNAAVAVDDKDVGSGPLIRLDLAVGGHAVRITAPKMHTYQGDVTIEDGQTRTLAIKLEPDPDQFSELRVAVGCRDPGVRIPNEGLAVYLGDSTISASPLGVRMQRTAVGEEPAYVPFTVAPGPQHVTVRIPGCEALSGDANASPNSQATIEGLLPPVHPFFNGSPAGSPDGWRVSAGFQHTTVRFDQFQNFYAGHALTLTPVDVNLGGVSGTFGFQGRWFTLLLDLRYVTGAVHGAETGVSETVPRPSVQTLSEEASFNQLDAALRVGARIPLYFAAVTFGPTANVGRFSLSPSSGPGNAGVEGGVGPWVAIDAQPLCDFGIQVGGSYSLAWYANSGNNVDSRWATTLFVHASYAPNTICDRKRAGLYQLRGTP
jgi:hypothetical protein